ncbi:MAG: hypothetical protein AAF197_09575, partial [Pseudomonadota bacterium]
PDFSEARGSAGYGAKEMIITAVSDMSRTSGAVRYVAYDRSTPNIIALQSAHQNKDAFKAPDFFIRGAVTQIEGSPYSKQKGFSLNVGNVSGELESGGISNSNSISLSAISLDLNMGMVSNFQLLPGVSASNTLSVMKKGDSSELILGFEKVGAIYSLNENSNQALSTALRGLIEVGLIELFGKLYDVPYWECLAKLGSNDPDYLEARKRFTEHSVHQTAEFVATELKRQSIMPDSVLALINSDGSLTAELREAVAHYRTKRNLFGSPVIDLPTFEALYRDSQRSVDDIQAMDKVSGQGWIHSE